MFYCLYFPKNLTQICKYQNFGIPRILFPCHEYYLKTEDKSPTLRKGLIPRHCEDKCIIMDSYLLHAWFMCAHTSPLHESLLVQYLFLPCLPHPTLKQLVEQSQTMQGEPLPLETTQSCAYSHHMSQKRDLAAQKARHNLGCIKRSGARRWGRGLCPSTPLSWDSTWIMASSSGPLT